MDSTISDRQAFRSPAEPSAQDVDRSARGDTINRVAAPLPATSVTMAEAAPTVVVAAPPPRRRKGRLVLTVALLAGLAGAGTYGWHWWTVGRFQQSTDNAYLQADKVTVAPKVGGFITAVVVGDNQPVKAGDVLARVDDRDYRIVVTEAQAELDKDMAQLDGFKAAVIQQLAQVDTLRADVANSNAALVFSQQEAKRYQSLLTAGAGTAQREQQTRSDLLQKQAAVNRASASLDAGLKQVETYKALAKSADAMIAGAEAKLDKAKLDLGETIIRAPIDGIVGDRSVRTGQLAQAGMALLTVVPAGRDIYLVANFKETQLDDIAVGQPVSFTVDAFPHHLFHGRIDSFAPGTGAQFALLPPENATGNFTKVVQRVPVRIALDATDPLLPRLRPGLSVEATVETRPEPGTAAPAAIADAHRPAP